MMRCLFESASDNLGSLKTISMQVRADLLRGSFMVSNSPNKKLMREQGRANSEEIKCNSTDPRLIIVIIDSLDRLPSALSQESFRCAWNKRVHVSMVNKIRHSGKEIFFNNLVHNGCSCG